MLSVVGVPWLYPSTIYIECSTAIAGGEITTWLVGTMDQRFVRFVIHASVWALIIVSIIIVGMSREGTFGVPLVRKDGIPDIVSMFAAR
jgi:UMF1 family MFS transporter